MCAAHYAIIQAYHCQCLLAYVHKCLHTAKHLRIVLYRDILCDIITYLSFSLIAVSCHHYWVDLLELPGNTVWRGRSGIGHEPTRCTLSICDFTSIEWSWNGLPIPLFAGRFRNSQNSELCSSLFIHYNNNNNNANIRIARLKQNSSGALMAQTNTVSVFVQMTMVTASGVADRPEDCSKLLLQWLRSSFCQV